MHARTRYLLASVILHAGVWLPAPGAAAGEAEEGREPAPARTNPGAVHLGISEFYLGLESEYEWRRVKSSVPRKRDTTQKNSDFYLAETLGLGLQGDIIDPALVDWQANLTFGLTQGWFRETIESFEEMDRDSGWLLEYDISIEALKTKPVSVSAYARHSDDRIPRRFLPSLRERQTEAGVSVLVLTGPATTEIGFSWTDIDRTGNRLDEDDESLRTTRFYVDQKWEFSESHRLRLSFDHEREESSYQGSLLDFDTRRNELRVEHELAFGPEDKHRLDTYLRFNDEHGDLARDEFEFVPRLSLQHTDKFKTVYRYAMYRFVQDAIELDQHKLDAQALYQPTSDLRVSADGFALYERVDQDVETYEWGAGLDVGYARPTPYGKLSADVAFGFDRARTVGDAGSRLVRGEGHQLGDVRAAFLRQTGVVRTSILAHNAERTRYYVEGADYTVTVSGGRAVVRRVPWGRIGEDEVVYFDYEYLVPARATVDSYRTDLLIEHPFKFGLTPYYAFEARFQHVESSPGTPLIRDNTDRHRFGLRYAAERWSVGTEYEIFDDAIEPYDAVHVTGQAALLRSAGHSLDLTGELSRYWFEGGLDDRRVWWLDIDLADRIQLNNDLSVMTTAGYRWEDDSVDGETNGVDVECGLRYTRGQLTVELTMEYDLLSIAQNRENGFGVFLNLRRDLTHVFPASWRTR